MIIKFKIFEDDGAGFIALLNDIHNKMEKYKPTELLRISELLEIKNKQEHKDIDGINCLSKTKKNDDNIIKLHGILMFLVCDELLKNPDEWGKIDSWEDIGWYINDESVTVHLCTNIIIYKDSIVTSIIREMEFPTEKVLYPLSYKSIKRFGL